MHKQTYMRTYWALLLMIVFTACGEQVAEEQPKEDLLSTDLVNNPHSANGLDSNLYYESPTMDFQDTVHNFGTINEGEKASFDFAFVNNGKTPLIISNATASCGCTVADYPKDPITPGEGGKIKVVFNSADKSGSINKSVSISTNTNRSVHLLYFKGNVIADPNKSY